MHPTFRHKALLHVALAAIAGAVFFALSGVGSYAARAQQADGDAPEAGEAPAPTPAPLFVGLPPSVSLHALPAYGAAPLIVGFLVNAIDPENVGFVRYEWNFGNGKVSTLPPILTYQTYNSPGSYTVTLTAVTADGRSAFALAGVVVRPPYQSQSEWLR